jgi:uncharacterized membrane protein YiaA
MTTQTNAPSSAFVGASWLTLFIGMISFWIGLYNSALPIANTGYFFTVQMYGLFSAVSVQKAVRDNLEGIPVSNIYLMLSWISLLLTGLLMVIGLWNTDLDPASKGFYAMSFVLSIFAAITVQKNIRDTIASKR